MKLTRPSRLPMMRLAAAWIAVFLVAVLLDRAAYHLLLTPDAARKDLTQVFRQLGYLPTWLIIALLVWLHDRRQTPTLAPGPTAPPLRPSLYRAAMILVSAGLSGVVANVLKPIIGRLRPDESGIARFAERPALLLGDQGEIGFGLPSGHTAVAFGGCAMLALLWPVWRVPMMLLAAGCATTRLLAGAHTLSDIVAAAAIGLAVAVWLHTECGGPRRGPAGGLALPA